MTRSQPMSGLQKVQCALRVAAKSRQSRSHRPFLILAAISVSVLLSIAPVLAQTYETTGSERKVISRVDPEYPDALKRLYIGGIVRVEVVVFPNGAVKETRLLGGNPILGQSTMKAIQRWKYAPAGAEQTLMVKVEFDPHR